MDAAKFWSLIGLVDVRLLDRGDDEAAVAPLVDALSALPTDGFLYARCLVVAKARAHYDVVLADPSRMPLLSIEAYAWA